MEGGHHHPTPEHDPYEKAYADGVEESIVVASSIEEELLLEAAEIEEVTFSAVPAED